VNQTSSTKEWFTLEKKVIFPFTRIHNPMLIEAHIEDGVIKDAYISGTLYRGFEQILIGRAADDMPYYTQRICGICSSAHAMAAAKAVEQALAMEVPPQGQLLRNLIVTGDFLQNHLRHLYLFAMPDYMRGPDIYPFIPHLEGDLRLSPAEEQRLVEHYFQANEMARLAHAAFAVFGGKAPHGHGIVPGGVSMDIDADRISRYRSYLKRIQDFINDTAIPDVEMLAEHYPEYIDDLGKGNGNYISVGGFETPEGSTLFASGAILKGVREPFSEKEVTEDVTTAWYKPSSNGYPGETATEPDREQPKGYTWVKGPRYKGQPVEVGPLARRLVAGKPVIGKGAIGRLWARTMEMKELADAAMTWINRLEPGAATLNRQIGRDSGIGVGLFEAMRGSLGHWIEVENRRVKHYQIITPSAWNFSCRDAQGLPSVGEYSIIGMPAKLDHLKEAGRVIRSFDPCFSCTVHLIEGDRLKTLEIRV